MRVLLVSGIYPPDIGGPATNIPSLARYLIDNQNSVEVVTLKNSSRSPENTNWVVHYIKRDQWLLKRFLKTIFVIFKHTKLNDAIFANGLIQETGFVLSLRKRNSIVKVVSDPVWERASNKGETNLSVEDFNHSKLQLTHKLQRMIFTWSLKKFTHITCPSNQLKSIIENWGVNKPVIIIPNGVAVNINVPGNKDLDLISVSRLIKLKNLDLLIIASKDTNTSLGIVGTGPEEMFLKNLSKSIGANVTFFGSIDNNKVPQILNNAKIYINLSDHEGLSFSLLEAMACGLPSIVSDIPGNTAVIRNHENGLIINMKNSSQLTSAIKFLIDSKTLRDQYGKSAVETIYKKYLQSKQLGKMSDLLIYGKLNE